MKDYIHKKRLRRFKKDHFRNIPKLMDVDYTHTMTKMSSDFPITRKITISDVGATIYITNKLKVNGEKIGHITTNGKLYNIVICPNPTPETNIDDDIIKQTKKCKGEA